MATNVFISYRRDDTRDFSARVADRLRMQDVQREGIGKIFFDVDTIEPGADFEKKIDAELKQCEFCLVMIGKDWLGKGPDGKPRVTHQRDFVRLEAREALTTPSVKILPVLVNEAAMPHAEDLPDDLAELPRLNAVSMRSDSFDRDIDYLIDVILKRKKPGSLQAYLIRHPWQAGTLRAITAFFATLLALVLVLALQQALIPPHYSLSQWVGNSIGLVWVIVIAVLGAGTAAPFVLGRRRRRQ